MPEIPGQPAAPAKVPIVPGPDPFEIDTATSSPIGGMQPITNSDPAPFDIDSYYNSASEGTPIEGTPEKRTAFASAVHSFSRPFFAQGYNSMAAVNRGIAGFSIHMDTIADALETAGFGTKGGIFEDAATLYQENADYWRERAEKVGITFVDEIISEAVGGAVPGITTFALDVASFYTFPFLGGVGRAEETGENPIGAGLLEAAKTGTLHQIFRMIGPLKQYLRAPTMGTVFGVQEAGEVPEGEKGAAFAKGFGTGFMYSVASPGGRLGMNEVVRGINTQLPALARGERGSIEVPVPGPDKKPAVKGDRTGVRGAEVSVPEFLRGVDLNNLNFKTGLNEIAAKAGVKTPPGRNRLSVIAEIETKFPGVIEAPQAPIVETVEGQKFQSFVEGVGRRLVLEEKGQAVLEVLEENSITPKQVVDRFLAESYDSLPPDIQTKINKLANRLTGFEPGSVVATKKGEPDVVAKDWKDIIRSIGEDLPANAEGLGGTERGFVVTLAASPKKGGGPPIKGVKLLEDAVVKQLETPPTPPIPGVTTDAPKQRQRKFIKTVEEAAETEPELTEALRDVDPQTYTVQPNKESTAAAVSRIEKEGLEATIDHVLSDAPLTAEKGAAFIELMDRFQRTGDIDRAVEMTEAYDLQLREAGRFIQAASMWNRLTPNAFIRWGNRQLDNVRQRYTFADSIFGRKPESFTLSKDEQQRIMELHKKANELPDGPEKTDITMQMIDVVAQKVPPSISELFDAYRYQNMLSSPRTQMRNIGENVFNTFITRPIDVATVGAIDYVKSALTGKEREAYVGDVPLYLKTSINAVPSAISAFRETWTLKNFSTLEKPDVGLHTSNAFELARAREIPKSLTVVSRFMEAMDKFNMALIGAGEMARLTKKGVPQVEAYKIAQEVSQTYLYRNKLDPADKRLSVMSRGVAQTGKWLQDARNFPFPLGTVLKWYVPFIRTPVNKSIQMIEKSPLGFLRDPRTFADTEVAAKTLAGAIVTGLGATLAYTNETTWSPPTNQEEKKFFYSSGRKPYSVKIGDKWIPYWYMGPYALSFAFPAATKHYYEERPEALTDDGVDKILAMSEGLARFVGSQSSTQSLGALFSAIGGDIDYSFTSQTGFTVQQIIPASGLVRYVNTMLDPVYRHPRGFIEQIEANLPGLSKNLDARMTPLLQEATRQPLNFFLPYDIGIVDPKIEALFPFTKFKVRQDFLDNKLEGVTRRLRNKEITFEESVEERLKIIEAAPKIFESLRPGENQ